MNRRQNFYRVLKITRATDEPPAGAEIDAYGDARRDAILWAAEEIERLKSKSTACTGCPLIPDPRSPTPDPSHENLN